MLVGRSNGVKEIIDTLQKLEEGNSDLRFWVGDFGSGKSFVLRTIESLALQKNFVVSTIDLTPTRRFYDSSGKALALYNEVVNKIVIKNNRDGNAIETIVQQWIQVLLEQIAGGKQPHRSRFDGKGPLEIGGECHSEDDEFLLFIGAFL